MTAAFLFGKLPSHGDFLARGLDSSERDSLDNWLSAEIASARRRLGENFEAAFDEARPWHFGWAEAGAWTGGSIAPSADSAGRRFPVIVARRSVSPEAVPVAAMACEEAIYDLFARSDIDAVIDRIASLALPTCGPAPLEEGWWSPAQGAEPSLIDGRRPEGLLSAMLATTGARQ